MKRVFVIGLSLAIIFAAISFISYKYLEKQRNYKLYKTMPDFTFTNLQNQIQNTSTLPKYNGYVVQLFNSDCEVCKEEAADYLQHNDSMQNILFLMLSGNSIGDIKDFALRQQLYNSDNFIFGHMEMKVFEAHFGSVNGPSIFIYNSNKELIGKISVANSESILNYFKINHAKWPL